MAEEEKGFVLNGKVNMLVLGILATALMSWAGVVFIAWQDTRDMLYTIGSKLERVQATVENNSMYMAIIARDVERHEERPWHDAAGNSLSSMRSELDALKRDTLKNGER